MFINEIRKPIRRNPLITRTLYYSKDMESFATGLKRIQDACDVVGCKVEYYGDDYGFTVRFYRHCGTGWDKLVHIRPQNAQADAQVYAQAANSSKILNFCTTPKTMKDIKNMLGVKDIRTARKYVRKLLETNQLAMTNPDKPNDPEQKYVTTTVNK